MNTMPVNNEFKDDLKEIYSKLSTSIWKKIPMDNINLIKPAMGISQKIYIATVTNENEISKFVIKYPTDNNLSRDIQIQINMTNNKVGPTILTHTNEFYVEEFIEGGHYNVNDMANSDIINKISNKLSELHSIKIEHLRSSLDNLKIFYDIIKKSFTQETIKTVSCLVTDEKIDEISSILKDTLDNIDMYYAQGIDIFESHDTLCVCHNDVHYENIIKYKKESKLIDFEFCATNHPEYDFINLYVETLIASDGKSNPITILDHVNKQNIYKLTLYNNIFWLFWTLVKLIDAPDKGYLQYFIVRLDRLNDM